MSDKLGPLAYGQKEEEIFLGREITRTRNFSESTAIAIDEEVKRIVTTCMNRSEQILRDNLVGLHRLANTLLEREILDGEEIDKSLRGEELPPIGRKDNGEAPSAKPEPVADKQSGKNGDLKK